MHWTFIKPRRNSWDWEAPKRKPRRNWLERRSVDKRSPVPSSNSKEPAMAAMGASLNHISRESSDIDRLAQFYKEVPPFSWQAGSIICQYWNPQGKNEGLCEFEAFVSLIYWMFWNLGSVGRFWVSSRYRARTSGSSRWYGWVCRQWGLPSTSSRGCRSASSLKAPTAPPHQPQRTLSTSQGATISASLSPISTLSSRLSRFKPYHSPKSYLVDCPFVFPLKCLNFVDLLNLYSYKKKQFIKNCLST